MALVRRLAVLLVASLLTLPIMIGTADPAAAWHRSYCGHTHSGGFEHGGTTGDGYYWWTKFNAHAGAEGTNGHRHWLEEYHHTPWGNQFVGYWGPIVVPSAGDWYGCPLAG